MEGKIPGVSAEKQRLAELDKKHYLHPSSSIREHQQSGPVLLLKEGKGIYLTDFDGKTYIDGLASLWNVNIGHGREELGKAAWQQMSVLGFSHSFSLFSHETAIELAAKLAALTPGDLNVAFFTSGGSDSNDTAFKLIRHYWKLKGQPECYKIISRKLAYHGVTIGASSATGIPLFHDMVSPGAPGFLHAVNPYCYNCELNKEYPGCNLACAEDFRRIIEEEGPETVAAVIVEPVQGAGGVIIPPAGYLKKVREICDEYGILMHADEVITGFGRTGKMFGIEHAGVIPDVMSLAKGITSGYIPLGAVVITERLHRELTEYSPQGILPHGLTYSGHPTSCAVALANIAVLEQENLTENSAQMGQILAEELQDLEYNYPLVGNFRAQGLIGAIELVKNKSTGEKFARADAVAKKVFEASLRRGLITRPLSYNTDIIALSPPLVINEEQVRQVGSILKEAVQEVYQEVKPLVG